MYFSKDMIEKAKTASSAEELKKMAAGEGVDLTAEEAKQYFALLNPTGALSDDDLEIVTGGKGTGYASGNVYTSGNEPSSAKYSIGQHIRFCIQKSYMTGWISSREYLTEQSTWYYTVDLDSDQVNHCNPTSSKQWNLPLEYPEYDTEVLSI